MNNKILTIDLENKEPFVEGEEVLIKTTVISNDGNNIRSIRVFAESNFNSDGTIRLDETEPSLFHTKEIDLSELELTIRGFEVLTDRLIRDKADLMIEVAKLKAKYEPKKVKKNIDRYINIYNQNGFIQFGNAFDDEQKCKNAANEVKNQSIFIKTIKVSTEIEVEE